MTNEWLIKDYEIRCYNLQNRLTPNKVEMFSIQKEAKRIQRKNKCDYLTALKTLKKQLEIKVAQTLGK